MIRTTDIDKIDSVLKHPEIWPLISDGEDPNTFDVPVTDDIHYLFEEGVLFILHPLGDDLEIHANILPEHREKSHSAALEALEYGFQLNDKIVARIPVKFGNVYGFTRKFMNDDGVIDGVHHLSLENKQWEERQKTGPVASLAS